MSIKISRIEKEFILRKMMEKKGKMTLFRDKKEFACTITAFDEESLTVSFPVEEIRAFRRGSVSEFFFVFEGTRHTFKAKISDIKGTAIVFDQPEVMMKSLNRKYERVGDLKDVVVHFSIKGKQIELNFPQTENYQHLENPERSEDFDSSSIRKLIISFRTKMNKLVSENKIIMLRNRLPGTYEEKIMVKTGRMIWIPSMEEGFIKNDIFHDRVLLTHHDISIFEQGMGTPVTEVEDKIKTILEDKFRKGYYSQLYCPLFFNEYLIGYIYLMNSIALPKKIDVYIIKYVYQFSKFLCHSLALNKYFIGRKSNDIQYESPIIDISACGLLFADSSKELANELILHSSVDISLRVQSRTVAVTARVSRKFRDAKNFYYGLSFTKIAPEDFRFLYENIYGKTYTLDNKTQIEDDSSFISDILS